MKNMFQKRKRELKNHVQKGHYESPYIILMGKKKKKSARNRWILKLFSDQHDSIW